MCPKCGSKYFAGFKAGTEKIEEELKKSYPSITILRMDGDTTKSKDDYDKILTQFAERKADVLVGTQMIVKGHDFPYVTLVGAIAADMSLCAQDYGAQEKTFQLLTQAAGRAGRGKFEGNVVIQTYRPEEYSLKHVKNQDYDSFYEDEIMFRDLSGYPPVSHMLAVQFFGRSEDKVKQTAELVAAGLKDEINKYNSISEAGINNIFMLGPSVAAISKIEDIYRYVIYIKCDNIDNLIAMKDYIENIKSENMDSKKVIVQFDFDPARTF